MSTTTLRPASTSSNTGVSIQTAGSAHAALNDDSDTTYLYSFGSGDTITLGLDDITIAAGAIVKSTRLRLRCAITSGAFNFFQAKVNGTTINVGAVWPISWTSPTTITVQSDDTAYSDAQVDALTLTLAASPFAPNSAETRIYEAFVDVVTVAKPVVNVTTPSGTLTTTNTPDVEWDTTLDADGGGQTFYEVRVFTDAQYGAGGFNPATSTAFDESGVIQLPEELWGGLDRLPDDTYRAYVRVAQTVNGTAHWSDWDYSEFTIDVDLPGVPLITAVAVDADAAIQVDVDYQAGTATTDVLEVQRSLDGGTTWEPVRLETDTDGVVTGLETTVFDLEAPNGTAMKYRARAGHNYTGEYSWSDWATAVTATWTSDSWWLKAPENPALNMTVVPYSVPGYQRPARHGVFQPLGSQDTIVVSDIRSAARGTLRLQVDTSAEQDDLDALIDSGLTLLLQAPPAHHWPDRYVRFGDQARDRWLDKAWVGEVLDTLPWWEVPAPAGVIAAWPTGGS
jgi:hypothetical protein